MKQIARRLSHLADWEAEVESKVTELPQGENESAGLWEPRIASAQLKLQPLGEGLTLSP